MFLEQPSHRAQYGIPRFMAVGIVESLEMIEIQEHHYERVIPALCPLQLSVKSVLHEPAVVQSSERVTDGLSTESLSQKQASEREGNAPTHCDGQSLLGFLQSLESFGPAFTPALVVLDMQDTQRVAQSY